LSLMAQMFSKDRLWFLLVPILVIHMLYMFFHDEYEGFRRRRRRGIRKIKRIGRKIKNIFRKKKKAPRCVTKTVNHCKALKKTSCRHEKKINKIKKIRGPEWMWKKKYTEELGRHKNTRGQYDNLKQLNRNYIERLGKAKNTSGSWLVS
jgi:DNA invertase Pin-like site-specific DNA recombinase